MYSSSGTVGCCRPTYVRESLANPLFTDGDFIKNLNSTMPSPVFVNIAARLSLLTVRYGAVVVSYKPIPPLLYILVPV